MPLPLTTLYAVPLTVLFFILWISVTKTRANLSISIGDGGNTDLHERIRKHGNFIEWVPFTLVLMTLAEMRGATGLWLHIPGALLLVGRLLHPFGLKHGNAAHPLRIIGNSASLFAVLILLACLVWTLTQG